MATLTIRDFDDRLRDQLRIRAAEHGRSMEAEVRAILRHALATQPESSGLGSRIHQRFASVGGVDLETPERTELPREPDLSS
ncbi:MAG: FitA-like ribbon-helix-helix domain-containing protein [Acidimicrobiales bacterium]